MLLYIRFKQVGFPFLIWNVVTLMTLHRQPGPYKAEEETSPPIFYFPSPTIHGEALES